MHKKVITMKIVTIVGTRPQFVKSAPRWFNFSAIPLVKCQPGG